MKFDLWSFTIGFLSGVCAALLFIRIYIARKLSRLVRGANRSRMAMEDFARRLEHR